MQSLNKRIQELEKDITSEPLKISAYHDMPFTIFRYDPQDKKELRKQVKHLATRIENHGRKVTFVSLAKFLWQAIDKVDSIDNIINDEIKFGFQRTQATIYMFITESDYTPLHEMIINEIQGLEGDSNILFILRAGALAPNLYQLSQLFGNMQGKTSVPAVLFYPGALEGVNGLRFMNMPDRVPIGSYRVTIYYLPVDSYLN